MTLCGSGRADGYVKNDVMPWRPMFFEIFIVKNDDILNSPSNTMPRIKGLEGNSFARRQTSQSGLGSRGASILSRD